MMTDKNKNNQPNHVELPSNPSERQKIKVMLGEMTQCMARIDSEREHKKEIADDISKTYAIPKKIVNKLASTMYKRDYESIQAEQEDFEFLYEALVSAPTSSLEDDEDEE